MPYVMRKTRNVPNCFKIYNRDTHRVFSKCATRKNALKQLRLLRAIHYSKDFVPYGSSPTTTRKTQKRRHGRRTGK